MSETMGFNEYQNESLRTAGVAVKYKPDFSKGSVIALIEQGRGMEAVEAFRAFCTVANAAMGMSGESGETTDYLKKVIFHGHKPDIEKVKKELGDQLWYISLCAWAFDLKMEDVAKANVLKLRERYPDGFDPARSQQRAAGDA